MKTFPMPPATDLIHDVGLGLRTPHYQYIKRHQPEVPWYEVLIDNYMTPGGMQLNHLEQIRVNYPITFHGVGLSIGTTDALNQNYLKTLKQRINEFQPAWVSDHLCWTSVGGRYSHELLPMPYTDEAIQVVVENISRIQDYLGQQILLENVSSYLGYPESTRSEWEFISDIVDKADCYLLLDINNIYVSSYNHQLDSQAYLQGIPVGRVKEMHLAGFEDMGNYLLDAHSCAVHDEVWLLYQAALSRFGPVPTLIEWDNAIPAFDVLMQEKLIAQQWMDKLQHAVA